MSIHKQTKYVCETCRPYAELIRHAFVLHAAHAFFLRPSRSACTAS